MLYVWILLVLEIKYRNPNHPSLQCTNIVLHFHLFRKYKLNIILLHHKAISTIIQLWRDYANQKRLICEISVKMNAVTYAF